MKKLQERNKLLNEHRSKDGNLKQRESGFQLYINGVHSTLPPRPPSVMRKRTDSSSNQIQTPSADYSSPTLSNVTGRSKSRHHRRRWIPITQTKLKTEQGSIIVDIHSQITNSNFHTKQSQPANIVNNQITYRLMTPINVDQSWMPNWYINTKSNDDNYNIKRSLCKVDLYERFIIKNHFLALSLDDIPATIPLTKSQQQTYRLSTMVGR